MIKSWSNQDVFVAHSSRNFETNISVKKPDISVEKPAYEILCTSRRTFQKVFPYLAEKPHIAALRLAQEQRRHIASLQF